MATSTTRKPKISVGSLIDSMWELRESKRKLEDKVKEINEQIEQLDAQLISCMDAEKITASTGNKASASITEAIRPNVVDWDSFYAFIHKHKHYHLLERRPSVTGCRELFETKGAVPGVQPFVKRTINLRTVK